MLFRKLHFYEGIFDITLHFSEGIIGCFLHFYEGIFDITLHFYEGIIGRFLHFYEGMLFKISIYGSTNSYSIIWNFLDSVSAVTNSK